MLIWHSLSFVSDCIPFARRLFDVFIGKAQHFIYDFNFGAIRIARRIQKAYRVESRRFRKSVQKRWNACSHFITIFTAHADSYGCYGKNVAATFRYTNLCHRYYLSHSSSSFFAWSTFSCFLFHFLFVKSQSSGMSLNVLAKGERRRWKKISGKPMLRYHWEIEMCQNTSTVSRYERTEKKITKQFIKKKISNALDFEYERVSFRIILKERIYIFWIGWCLLLLNEYRITFKGDGISASMEI